MTIKKTDLPELIVIFLFSIYIFLLVLRTSVLSDFFSVSSILKIYKLIVLCILPINLINIKKMGIHSFYILTILLGIVSIVAFKSDTKTELLIPILFALNGVFIKDSKIIKIYLIIVGISVLSIVLLSLIGFIENDMLIENRGIRYYLGFKYTLFTPNFFLHIITAYIALKKRSITFLETVIILLLNQAIYYLTNGRSVYYITVLSIIVLWIYKLYPKVINLKISQYLIYSIYPLFTFISIGVSYLYSDQNYYFRLVDKVLSGRLRLGNQGIKEYGIPLFGQIMDFETGRQGIERSGAYFYIDSSFLKIAVNLGIIFTIILVVLFTILMISSYKVKNYYLCIALAIMALHSLIDDVFFDLRYNPFLLLLGLMLVKELAPTINPDNW